MPSSRARGPSAAAKCRSSSPAEWRACRGRLLSSAKSDAAFARGLKLEDTTLGWRFVNPRMQQMYGIDAMGETAENVAAEWKIARADQDAFAYRSQQRAAAGRARLAEEIVPVSIAQRKETVTVDADEHPRADTTLEALARLKPVIRPDGTVTAGNASGINDGACALILASEDAVKAHGLTPRAQICRRRRRRRRATRDGHRPCPGDPQGSRTSRPDDRADGRHRAQRSVRGASRSPCFAISESPTTRHTSTPMAAQSPSAIPSERAARAW